MLLVKTYLDKSKIQGIGLFSDEFIPKGTLMQIERIDRTTSIALRPEGGGTYYWINARELLNEEYFQRVF